MRGTALLPSRAEARVALACALPFALAFPPFRLVVPAFVCLAPIGVAVAVRADDDGGGSASDAARLGFWFGALGYGANLYWLGGALSAFTRLAIAGYLAALVLLGVIVAGVSSALFVARRATRWPMAILLPIIWVAGEVGLERLPDVAFPWLPLGLAVTPAPMLAQIADLSGVHGVSVWIAATNGIVADLYIRRTSRRAVVWRTILIVGVAACVAAYGTWRMRTIATREVTRVAIIQPNVPPDERWQSAHRGAVIGMLSAGTRDALVASRPALVVWPEAALPDFLDRNPAWRDSLATLARAGHVPLLVGVFDVERREGNSPAYFNAAMLVDADGRVTRPIYHKRRLVPIVERVPFTDPAWSRAFGPYAGGYGRGDRAVVYSVTAGRFGVLICYESIFPSLSREYRRADADFLLTITNDAWFGRTLAPYQHLAHLVLRAIEARAGVVRAANTGISGYIDPFGRVRAATELFVPAVRTYSVETTDVRSPYVRWGDWSGGAAVLAAVSVVALGALRGRRERPTRHQGSELRMTDS